jgi:hypothetical protein
VCADGERRRKVNGEEIIEMRGASLEHGNGMGRKENECSISAGVVLGISRLRLHELGKFLARTQFRSSSLGMERAFERRNNVIL